MRIANKIIMPLNFYNANQKIFYDRNKHQKIKPPRHKSDLKAIIIGNSPSILKEEHGKTIDGFDIVIRINRCITEGYEKYIGSKTDIWSTTSYYLGKTPKGLEAEPSNGIRFCPPNLRDLKSIWYRTPKTYESFKRSYPDLLKQIKNKDNYYFLWKTKDFAENFKEFISDDPAPIHRWGYENTGGLLKNTKAAFDTGLLTILTSTLFFNDVTIHGFDFFTESTGGVTCYYREKELDASGCHPEDPAWERARTSSNLHTQFITDEATLERRQIIQKLIKRKQLKIFKNGPV